LFSRLATTFWLRPIVCLNSQQIVTSIAMTKYTEWKSLGSMKTKLENFLKGYLPLRRLRPAGAGEHRQAILDPGFLGAEVCA
jgi:hypothetical protein